MEKVRLQKYIASCGICSRRNAENLICNGLVKVNGKVISELGTKIIPGQDKVEYNGKEIIENKEYVYVLLNKPIGYVTTVKEQFGRPTVIDLVKKVKVHLLPVGRLDMYTSGAIILTNDGDFIYKVTHPKNEVEKTYNATVKGIVTNDDVKTLESGVKIENYGVPFGIIVVFLWLFLPPPFIDFLQRMFYTANCLNKGGTTNEVI